MKNLQRTTSGAAGKDLNTTIKYLRYAAGINLSTTIKYLRRTTSGAAGVSSGAGGNARGAGGDCLGNSI
jgi:hypothetical protein